MSIKLQKKAPAMAVVVVYYMHNSRVLQKKCLFPFLHIHIGYVHVVTDNIYNIIHVVTK